MERRKFSEESLREKFISLLNLEGLLQQYQVAEDSIVRDRKFMEIIREVKPNFKDWRDNIHYDGKYKSFPKRTIDRDYGVMCYNINKSKEIMKRKKEKIREQCIVLGLNFKEIIETKKIPTIYILTILPEYLEYLNTQERKRTCSYAFGEKYSETRLEYYT